MNLNISECSWNKCKFCAYNNKKIKPIDIDKIKEDINNEIEKVKNGKQKYVKIFNGGSWFNDEIPNNVKKTIYEMLEKNNVKKLRIENRIDEVNFDEVKKLIDKSYELSISWGIESVNNDILRYNNKGITIKEVEKCLLKSKNLGCNNIVYLLMGLPKDEHNCDIDGYKESIDWVKKNHHIVDEIIVGYYSPMKGSYWYDKIWKTNKFRVISKKEADGLREYAKNILKNTNINISYFIYTWRYYNGKTYDEYISKLKRSRNENKRKKK